MDKLKQHNQKLSRSIYDLRDELDDSEPMQIDFTTKTTL